MNAYRTEDSESRINQLESENLLLQKQIGALKSLVEANRYTEPLPLWSKFLLSTIAFGLLRGVLQEFHLKFMADATILITTLLTVGLVATVLHNAKPSSD